MSQFCRAAYLLASTILVAFLIGKVWNPPAPPPFQGLTGMAVLPSRVGEYQSRGDVILPEKTRTELAGNDFIARTYTNEHDISSSFDFALLAGTDRTMLHDPRGCMIGAGWNIENDHTEVLPQTSVAVRVSDMVGTATPSVLEQTGRFGAPDRIAKDGLRYEVLYTYLIEGKIVQQVTQIRGQMLLAALIGQRGRPVFYCIVMRPHRDDPVKDRQDGEQMRQFAASMWKKMDLETLQRRQLLIQGEQNGNK